MPRSIRVSVGVLVCLLFVLGCSTPLSVKQMQAKNPFAKNAPKTPTKMVDAWNSYAQAMPDGTIVRGMAGRVHFFDDHNGDKTVKVDGDMTVYVFDGKETDPVHTKPLKVFQFKANTLDKHYSFQKPMGHGYSFFLPMGEIDGEEQSLSIIARFDNHLDDGRVMSQPVSTILAGRKPERQAEPTIREFLDSQSLLAETNRSMTVAHNASTIRQVSHISETTVAEPAHPKSSTTTIPLNSAMTRRLHSAASLDAPTPSLP